MQKMIRMPQNRYGFSSARICAMLLVLSLLVPAQMSAQRYIVTDFFAKGDGQTLNTRSIQAAIDSAHAYYVKHGQKSTVVVPPGQFVCGSIYLKSGVTLQIDRGGVLLGSLNPFDYVKDSICRLMAFVFAVGQHDIAITGQGTIDGRGFEVANAAVNAVHLGLLSDPLKYDRCNESNRPQNVHFRECDDVTISGITLKDPANWCQEYDRCRRLTIDGITVDAKCYWNNDGLDIVDCQDVVVRNCYIDASDDAYCFKSHNTGGVSENVVVENCVGRSSANGIKFGTLTRGTFRHFRFRNITIKDTYRSAITIASVDGGHVEDIEVDGLRSMHTGNPIFLRFSSRNKGTVEPCVKDIVIKNMYAEVPFDKPDAGYRYEGPVEDMPRNISPSSIVGCPGMRIENVRLENVEIVYPGRADAQYAFRGTTPAELAAIPEWEKRYPEFSMWKELPAWGFYIRHADNIVFDHVTLRLEGEDYRPALVADDVRGLVLENSRLQPSDSKCQVVLNNTEGYQCHSSKLKKQENKKTAASAVSNTATLTSDQILAQDNASVCTDGARLYKASMFGCKSNGITMNTASIQKAIDYIATHGGGTLVFEVGRYLTGSILLREGVNIQLNEGAIWVGSPNPYDYSIATDGKRVLLMPDERYTTRICGLGMIVLDPGSTIAENEASVECRVICR